MSKVAALGLQTALVTAYDQTKTTLQGNIGQRTITDGNGAKLVVGPNPVVFADVFDDTGVAPLSILATTSNGRIFVNKALAAGVATLSMYQRTMVNGNLAVSWVGDLKFQLPNVGAYTMKGLSVDDTNPAAMNFHFFNTNTTLIQGGWYAVYGVNQTQFVKVSIQTLPTATTASQTGAVYQIGDTTTQAAQTITVADGGENDPTNGFVYVLNGAAATPSIYKFVNTVPTTAPVAGYSQANGAIIKTAVLPALAGVVLLLNNVKLGTVGAWSPNSTFQCLMWVTTTNIYHAKVTDITNGATSLPSLVTGTLTDGTNLAATASGGTYSPTLDKFCIFTSLGNALLRTGLSNDVNQKVFGLSSYIKTEIGGTITPPDFGAITAACLAISNGIATLMSTGVGQRGFFLYDLTADESSVANASAAVPGQINASIISPVLTGLNITKGIVMGQFYELAKRSVRASIQYRTSNFSTGPGAGFDATWTAAPKDGDLSALTNVTSVQFRILFSMAAMEVTNPPQLNELYFIYNDATQISDNWEGSVDNSTGSGASPMYVAFRLRNAYPSVVPKLFIRGIDDSGNTIFTFDTVTNSGVISYTTNNGTSWTPLGTIPNTALTTEVRVNVASPSGTRLTWTIAES